jgi:pimeloyl-ACP methyl ester carboxylesterase
MTKSAAGHWDGAIEIPSGKLQLHIKLRNENEQQWTGTIDIPVQGMRGYQLAGVQVTNEGVAFSLPNIPGDPRFDGKLAPDGKTIEGDFHQGGQRFKFQLKRADESTKTTSGATPVRGIPGQGVPGFWQGSLHIGPIELRLVFKIKQETDDKLSGLMDSIDQNARDIPVSSVTEKDGNVKIEVQAVRGSFSGKMSADGSEVAGKWTQPGVDIPLVLRRLPGPPNLARPQEPKEPYPYQVEEVALESGNDVRLAGTFTHPSGQGPFPAAVLISGSGPQDRDEGLMGHRPFLVLADHLTRHGIAVLRYDDRGVGKSTGNYGEAAMDEFVADSLAAVKWLQNRPEVDKKRIGLVGHSEGSVIATIAATKAPSEIKFLVFLAGVGVPMEQLLARQAADIGRAMGMTDELLARNVQHQRKLFEMILKQDIDQAHLHNELKKLVEQQLGELTDEQRKAMGISDEFIQSQLAMMESKWFRRLLQYDPAPLLRQVRCPVLAINGDKDLQVAADENLAGMRRALEAGGHRNFEVLALPGLNHLFQTADTGLPSEYGQIEETFSPSALEIVSRWILANSK